MIPNHPNTDHPHYVTDAADTMLAARVPRGTKMKDLSPGEIYETGGRYYLPVGRIIMRDQDEWAHVPTHDVDVEQFAHDIYQMFDDFCPFSVSIDDFGDGWEIHIDIPLREGDDHNMLAETVLCLMSSDSRKHFKDAFLNSEHTHVRYLTTETILPGNRQLQQ